jgi:D-tyrosyl-tRNA(Tyr) deacylase
VKALIQRVKYANVKVDDKLIGEIKQGLLVFLGIEKNDKSEQIDKMIKRLLSYRVFNDAKGRLNLSVKDVAGSILLVSQFTLAANTKSGTRAGFSTAKAPNEAKAMYDDFLLKMRSNYANVSSGKFGADMQVSLLNDGPITFLLEC